MPIQTKHSQGNTEGAGEDRSWQYFLLLNTWGWQISQKMEYFIFICFVCVIKSEVNPLWYPPDH